MPDTALVTEEQADTHGTTGASFLIVDPLDGTREFIQRRGDFTVNIALVENGVPVGGIVYAPAKDRMFYTDATGASVEETGPFDHDTPGQTRRVSLSTPDAAALIVVASKSHRDAATTPISTLPRGRHAQRGSSLKFCLVAAGEADLYPRLGRTMEWDTAAGDAVLRGAGGQVLRFRRPRALALRQARL